MRNNITMSDRFILEEEFEGEDSFSVLAILSKYGRYWRWFLAAILISLLVAYIYVQYAPTLYMSVAKIKIIEEGKQTDITSNLENKVFGGLSDINLENEIEVIKSYRLLQQVVTKLNLDITYYSVGFFKNTQIWDAPFIVTKFTASTNLNKSKWYDVELQKAGFEITDEDGNNYLVPFNGQNNSAPGLPFSIELSNGNIAAENFERDSYEFELIPNELSTNQLIEELKVEPANKNSDILTIWLKGESVERSETILNTIIKKFNEDGIEDKQAISKRTLDFIDERFLYLSGELDSIELGKQDFKQDNTVAYIEEDATTILKRKSDTEEELFNLETQLSLLKLLSSAVIKEDDFGLLPPDIGLNNSNINSLVSNYNELSRERTRQLSSMPENHPTMRSLRNQLSTGKENILKTLDVNQRQLSKSLSRLRNEKALAGELFSKIPEKEKMLRAIERQQSIKENLFLLLLEKREEAAIDNAVTAPVIKVIDYAQTIEKPVSPKKILVYPIAMVLGFFGSFLVLFVKFALDTRIHGRPEIEKLSPDIPIISEIPFYDTNEGLLQTQDRSIITESFRILCTNIIHTSKTQNGSVILVTSSIKGEGKTSTAVNLATTFASMNKKVLLIGGDFRNPKLHSYFGLEKESYGISNFISDPEMDWKQCIQKVQTGKISTYVCLSGTKGHNPPEILTNGNIRIFMEQAKNEFDHIIVDTAPILLVSDTRLISKFADITLFVLRVDFTEKRLLEFSKELNNKHELKNMGYILNAVGANSSSEKYNYGYGYGYEATMEPKKNKSDSYKNKLIRKLKNLIVATENITSNMVKKIKSKWVNK